MIPRIHTTTGALPSFANVPRVLAIPVGGCGCGKSTALANMFPGAVVSDADEWKKRHPLYTPKNPGGPDDIVHEWSKEQALTECFGFLADGMAQVIYDTTGGSVGRVASVAEVGRALGYRVVMVRLWTPRETAWARNTRRERTVRRADFDRTHDRVRTSWGRLMAFADDIVNVCDVNVHEVR